MKNISERNQTLKKSFDATILSAIIAVFTFLPVQATPPVFSVTGYLAPRPLPGWRSKKTQQATEYARKERYQKFEDETEKDSYPSETELFKAIADFLKQNPNKRLILYIHGCCHLYPETLGGALNIAEKLDDPVLIYNWPSTPFHVHPSKWHTFVNLLSLKKIILSHNGYNENEQGYSNGKGQFNFFVQEFDKSLELNGIDTKRIIVLAHSMGNRLLDDEMEIRAFVNENTKRQDRKYKKVIFACADVGMEEFHDVTRLDRVSSNAEDVWILINEKDPALKLSRRIHGYHRLGSLPALEADPLFLGAEGNIKVVDHTKVTGKDHSLPIDLIVDIVNSTSNKYKLVPSAINKRVLEAK